jgi:monoamine oxidase
MHIATPEAVEEEQIDECGVPRRPLQFSTCHYSNEELTKLFIERYGKKNQTTVDSGYLDDLSRKGWNAFTDSKGHNMINLKHGYGQVVTELEKIVGSEKIRLQEPVIKINYSESQVEITTKKNVYNAKCVLVTIPLGVLKKNHSSIFDPQLPEDKIHCIEELDLCQVNKFFIVFEYNVFDDDSKGLQIIWEEGTNIDLQSVNKHKIENEFYKTFTSYDVSPTMKNVLCTSLYGENALYSESLSDQALTDVLSEIFAKCFPEIQLPAIKQVVRSKWDSNPYTLGACSFVPPHFNTTDFDDFRTPIENKLFFAGEGTSSSYRSTVHGAYASGKCEAASIINAIQKLLEEPTPCEEQCGEIQDEKDLTACEEQCGEIQDEKDLTACDWNI